ncbi:uncharacterized protein LOC114275296 [Camellia sinensis]|uniref:uncharacterized protein LOC114275296 n=1 Tax=Camellia sinensis TaxID=4442 RepID=UPI00103648FC|nr:uncharacterized protein LOC114275296 [Camellia sinensis]
MGLEKILSLRKNIFPLIKFKIVNGEKVFLWFDNWHPLGSLWDRFGHRIMYDTGLPFNSKVSAVISNNDWKWPIDNSWEIKEWISSTPIELKPSRDIQDCPVWNLTVDGNFTIQSAWDCWRDKGTMVPWANLVWGSPSIPRVSFVVWMAIHERLNTGNRLHLFGLVPNPTCPLCHGPVENHSHLFFRCVYSSRIWGDIQVKCNISWLQFSWLEYVVYATKSTKGKDLKSALTKLSFLCTVYQIWIERNRRIFSKEFKPEKIVTNLIVQMVRGRMLSMYNLANSAGDAWYLSQWNLPTTIMKQPQDNNAGSILSGDSLPILRVE